MNKNSNTLLDTRFLGALTRINDSIKMSALVAKRHLDRELVWIKTDGVWIALQDCLSDPYIKRDVAFYDEDLFLVHILDGGNNPNEDCNELYKNRWVTYDLYKYSIQKALSEFLAK